MATHSSTLAWRIPMDKGDWQATVHGVSKSKTRLGDQAQQSTNQSLGLAMPKEALRGQSLIHVNSEDHRTKCGRHQVSDKKQTQRNLCNMEKKKKKKREREREETRESKKIKGQCKVTGLQLKCTRNKKIFYIK